MDAVEDYNFGLGEDVTYYDSADDEEIDHDCR